MKATLVVKKGAGKKQVIELRSLTTLVGRMLGCDLRIPSKLVSRHHCKLRLKYDYLSVEDLDSANGTFVNGARIDGKKTLRPGDQLQVGPVVFEVKYILSKNGSDNLDEGDETVARAIDVEPVSHAEDEAPLELTVEDGVDAEADRDPTGLTPALRDKPKKTKIENAEEEPRPGKKKSKKAATEDVVAKKKKAVRAEDEEPVDASQILEDRPMDLPSGDDLRSLFADMDDK